VYVAGPDANLVHVLDTSNNTVIAEISVPGKVSVLALTPDATRLYAAISFNADTVAVIDTATNSVVATISVSGEAFSVAITPDGKRAYVTMEPNNLSVIDTATNTVIDTVTVSCPASFGPGFIGPAPWQPLLNKAQFNAATALLLTDGTVMVQHSDINGFGMRNWSLLAPDNSGSYVNGQWTNIASTPSHYAPTYFASAVLKDGRVIVEGGEYNFGMLVYTVFGAIFNPTTGKWRNQIPPPDWHTIGDAQSAVLADGTFMIANC
jgi:YVTN family beta-propeller protein